MKLKLPNITGRTAEEQVKQMGTYLRQLVQELNWALSSGDQVSREDMEKVRNEVGMLSKQVEQLGIRLQEHIKGG